MHAMHDMMLRGDCSERSHQQDAALQFLLMQMKSAVHLATDAVAWGASAVHHAINAVAWVHLRCITQCWKHLQISVTRLHSC
jgi:hypothetical protein